jgi:mannose-6-phosphate isomerase-like protein (cupin superfamily)
MEQIIKIINIANAEHYNWGNNCDGWHLVNNDKLSIIREKMHPGSSEVMHYHQKSGQFFYILSGTACMEVEDKRYILLSSDGIEIPPHIPHRIFNDSSEELNFIVVSLPKSHGDRIEVNR